VFKALRDVFLVLHTFIFSMKSFQTNYKCPIISNFQHAAMIYASGINDWLTGCPLFAKYTIFNLNYSICVTHWACDLCSDKLNKKPIVCDAQLAEQQYKQDDL